MAISLTLLIANSANAEEHNHSQHQHHHSSNAPIGVMGGHTHEEGDWMFSYRYSHMKMDGNRDGTNNLSPAETRAKGFMVAPLDMSMEMHMFGAMYGASDNLTLMGMLPYVRKSMNHETGALAKFDTVSEGVGDTKISGLYKFYDGGNDSLHLNLGLSLPTGSIKERDDTPAANNAKLPYPMQLGSGTFDPLLGLTYLNNYDSWSFGGQAGSVLRFGENSQGYRLGNEYNVTGWIANNVSDNVELSLRLEGKSWGNIKGSDDELNPAMVPTARTDLRGGKRVDAIVGVSLLGDEGMLDGHRLAIEFGMPVYENLDGPQLSTDYRTMIGWQKAL